MEVHEAANIFPIDEENISDLAKDIRDNGQQVPIDLLDGKILDGRRREKACRMIGIEPKTRNVKVSDPVAYVLSLNLHRRHLSESQRAMVGARARKMYDDQAKERMHEGKGRDGSGGRGHKKNPKENLPDGLPVAGQARDRVGKVVGVSGKSIDYASKVLKNGTEKMIDAVDAGKIAVSHAARMATLLDPEQQDDFAENVKGRPNTRKEEIKDHEEEEENDSVIERKGVGVDRANEAINCLIRIPKNDALRKRGFQIVTDWIKANK